MNRIAEQAFFSFFCNSPPTYRGRRILAIYYVKDGFYRRYVDQAASFDYIKYGSEDTYDLTFRIVRFPISEDTYECLVTNLPKENFSVEKLKEIYNSRWGIESSFRKLKYTIGLSHYHSYKPDFIKPR